MRPEVIDLFVDRLCGIFPKDNIARNTVKNAWNRDDFLLGCDEEHGKIALQMLEHDDTFPNLKRVKEVFRMLSAHSNARYAKAVDGMTACVTSAMYAFKNATKKKVFTA